VVGFILCVGHAGNVKISGQIGLRETLLLAQTAQTISDGHKRLLSIEKCNKSNSFLNFVDKKIEIPG
jgi:hypothetical protein